MSDHNGTGANWNVDDPATATDYVSEGATELRDLRVGVEMRLNKEHAHIAAGTRTGDALNATGGGEHLEGSARIHTATSAPTNLVFGAVDQAGVANNITISGNEALAEGMMWVDTDSNYVLQVYAASGWRNIGYINSNTTLTTATTAGTIAITGTAASIGLTFTNASTNASSASISVSNSNAGNGILVTNSSTTSNGILVNQTGIGGVGIYSLISVASGVGIYASGTAAGCVPLHANYSKTGNDYQGQILYITGSNTSGSGKIQGIHVAITTDSGDATVFYLDAASASGVEYLFDFANGEAGELTGHTAAGNSGFVSNSKGTFTLVGCIKMKDHAGATVYIPYGTIA